MEPTPVAMLGPDSLDFARDRLFADAQDDRTSVGAGCPILPQAVPSREREDKCSVTRPVTQTGPPYEQIVL
jgi:hypothetical protein